MNSRLWGALCSLIVCNPISNVNAGLLYAVQEDTNTLISIDTNTLSFTSIGPLGIPFNFGGLAYDLNTDTLYMIGGRDDEKLYTVDRMTAQSTLIGTHGITSLLGLAFDSTNNVLYGSQFSSPFSPDKGLFSLNTTTGSATNINPSMTNRIGGLAYDSNRDMLVGSHDGGGAGDLYLIDRSTGTQTLLADGSDTNNSGLAYDSDADLFWQIDWSGDFYQYDPNAGYSQSLVLQGLGSHDGLAYVSTIPVPAAVWLFGSGLLGLIGIAKRKKA